MTYLLDSNVCIVHVRSKGIGPIATRLLAVSRQDVRICSVVVAELIFGALRSRDVHKELTKVRSFATGIESIPFDDSAAGRHAEIRAYLAPRGQLIGPLDLMIAAIARANGLTLVTHNTAEFSRVPGLKLEDWEMP